MTARRMFMSLAAEHGIAVEYNRGTLGPYRLGQEAKASPCRIGSLFWLIRSKGADDGSRKDGGDFASTGAGAHLRGRCEFDVLHDGSEELQPSEIVSLIVRSGWQFRVIGGKNFRVNYTVDRRNFSQYAPCIN